MRSFKVLALCLFAGIPVSSLFASGTVWSEVVNNVAYIHHDKAEFNCCPDMVFEMEENGNVIDIYEKDKCTNPCLCDCEFDFTHKLEGLEPGTYTAKVWESSQCDDKYSLSGSTVFKIEAKTDLPSNQSLMSECGGWTGTGEHPFPEMPWLSSERIVINDVKIEYMLPENASPEITIYNILGVKIRFFSPGPQSQGIHSFNWDTRDDKGIAMPKGVYFVRLEVLGFARILPLVVLR